MKLLDRQKEQLASALHDAWHKYEEVFGVPPQGAIKQLRALVELAKLETFVQEIAEAQLVDGDDDEE